MKRIIYVFTLFLYATFSVVFSQEVETLWQKGGTLPNSEQFTEHGRRYNGGWYHDNLHIYELEGSNLFLYNPKTQIKEKIQLEADANLKVCSPQCRFIITERNDSMFSYNVKNHESVFLRKGFADVAFFEESGTYVLLKNGEVYNISSGIKINSLENFEYNVRDFFYSGTVIFLPNFDNNTVRIKDIVTNSEFSIKYWEKGSPLISGSLALSPNKKSIAQCTHKTLAIMDVFGDTVMNVRNITNSEGIYLHCSFVDTNRLVVLKAWNSKYIVQYINVNTLQSENTYLMGTDNTYYSSNFADVIKHTNNDVHSTYTLRSYFDDDCGGIPSYGQVYKYQQFDTEKPNTIHEFPEYTSIDPKSITFLEGDSTIAYITNDSTLIVRAAESGEKIHEWRIPSQYIGSPFPHYTNLLLPFRDGVLYTHKNKIYRYSLTTNKLSKGTTLAERPISSLRFSTDKKLVVCLTSDDGISIVDPLDLSTQHGILLSDYVSSAALVGDTLIYCFESDSVVYFHNINNPLIVQEVAIDSCKHIDSKGSTYLSAKDSKIKRIKDNTTLNHHAALYQPDDGGEVEIYPVDNMNGLWNIVKKKTNVGGDEETNSHVTTVQVQGKSLVKLREWKNRNTCHTLNAVFSSDGKYCATVGGTLELHKISGLISSVANEDVLPEINAPTAYYTEGDALIINDEKVYENCTLYSLTGENLGTCHITKNGNSTRITIPYKVQNGFYILSIRLNTDIVTKRIILNR